MKRLLPVITTLLVSQQLLAEPELSPYSFGGSCPSQGTWTQTVLSQSQRLKEVIQGLADDPNCKALHSSMQEHLLQIQTSMSSGENQQKYTGVSQLMGQIGALTGFMKSGNAVPAAIANQVLDAKVAVGEADAKSGLLPDTRNKMGFSTLAQRAAAATDSGLDMFNKLVSGVKNQERCIQSQGGLTGEILSGSVYLLSAFAASGDSAAGAKISQALSSLAEMVKSSKYRQALAKLDMTVYQNSLRCLMEMSAETFCSVTDNFEIVKLGVDSMSVKSSPVVPASVNGKTPKHVTALVSNPFSGMYVLTHHLPNITAFIQKVMLGVEPNTPFEGAQKNEIIEDLSAYQQSVNAILGTFNRAAMNVANTSSQQAQRSQILSMLEETYDAMRESGKITNFFRTARPMSEWKLFLLGIPKEAWPKEFFSGDTDWSVNYWLETNSNNGSIAAFANPNELIGVIRQNLLKFVDEANLSATAYYSQWYLADKVGILDSLVADQRFTVKESLTATINYLTELERRVRGLNGEKEILISIADTKNRIRSSLKALDFYINVKSGNPTELQAAATTAVSQIYADFNVLLSRTGFLSSRIANYVRYDYRLLMHSGLNMTDYQRSLLLVMGQDLMGQMQLMQNKSLQAIQSDLNNASGIALTNLQVFEDVFAGEFAFQMSLWKMKAEGKKIDNWSVGNESNKRLQQDATPQHFKAEPGDGGFTRFMKGLNSFFSFDRFFNATAMQFDEQRYPNVNWPGRKFSGGGVDDEHQSAQQIFAQMCIQSLAFNKWQDYGAICEKAILKSVFDPSGSISKLSMKYADAYIQAKVKNRNDQQEKALKQRQRICSFRDFYRNNYVHQLTVGAQRR